MIAFELFLESFTSKAPFPPLDVLDSDRSPGGAGPWAHLHDTRIYPSDFPCTLARKRPKANSDIKDLSPALNKHLQKVYLRLIRKKLGMATSVTTLKCFLPVEELQVLKTHNANILLNPPQSAAPDDACSSLLLYSSLRFFLF